MKRYSKITGENLAMALSALLVLAFGIANPAYADRRDGPRDGSHNAQRDTRRASPARYYDRHVVVRPGHVVRDLPRTNFSISIGNNPYWYSSGLLYGPGPGPGYYRVVPAPIGARVRVLPPGYVSFGYLGRDYFYFNSTFYLWDEPRREYVVVDAPENADEALARANATQAVRTLFVYPAQGQAQEQQDRDRYECHMWAVEETDYEPAMATANDPGADDYRRALTACLEGRGYTVR